MTEERMPDVIGTLVTLEGVDVGRELVDLKLMERYDPSRNVQPIPQIPLFQGVYAHEKNRVHHERQGPRDQCARDGAAADNSATASTHGDADIKTVDSAATGTNASWADE